VADVQVDGSSLGALTSYTFYNVQTSHTISVTFVLNVYTVNITAATGGSITVTGSSIQTTTVNGGDSSTLTVNPGASISLTITPDAGRSVRSVADNNVYRYGITSYSLTNIMTDHTINVYFK
jgi:endoglucanase